jgi:CheY-like chemotaxis protein
LIVDGYSDGREMYSEYVQFSGYDVVEAANGNRGAGACA